MHGAVHVTNGGSQIVNYPALLMNARS